MSTSTDGDSPPFYALLDGASSFTLMFEVDAAGEGPIYQPDGTLAVLIDGQIEEAEVQALHLGDDRYRLCENNPLQISNMHWGDEFFAVRGDGDRLQLTRVAAPSRFQHVTLVLTGGMDPDGALSRLVHRFGGGWEAFAVGVITITIPAENWDAFEAAADLPDWERRSPHTTAHSSVF